MDGAGFRLAGQPPNVPFSCGLEGETEELRSKGLRHHVGMWAHIHMYTHTRAHTERRARQIHIEAETDSETDRRTPWQGCIKDLRSQDSTAGAALLPAEPSPVAFGRVCSRTQQHSASWPSDGVALCSGSLMVTGVMGMWRASPRSGWPTSSLRHSLRFREPQAVLVGRVRSTLRHPLG